MLIRELCDIANDAGLERMVAEMVVGPRTTRSTPPSGWASTSSPPRGMAKDQNGRDCDTVLMAMPLGRYYEWSKF
jgi:hypothetical protein